MRKLTTKFISHVRKIAQNPSFTHHSWFVKYHLEIVEKIALELCDKYPKADKDIVLLLVWFHDYGKIIDFNKQYEATIIQGEKKLLEIGFEKNFVKQFITHMELFDKKEDLHNAPIEVQIVSSADGASHLIGPFFSIFWKEHPDWSIEQLRKENQRKALIDWDQKIVLPEVKKAFESRHKHLLEFLGNPAKKFSRC